MYYLLYGSDTKRSRDKLVSLLAALQEKKPDAPTVRLERESFSPEDLPHLLGGQGLFEERCFFVLDNLLGDEETGSLFSSVSSDLAESKNVFIFIDEKPDTRSHKALQKHAYRSQEFEARASLGPSFNVFALSDALGHRDRSALWVLYQKALRAHLSAEEIHGLLLWQVKSMVLALKSKTAGESGLKPFVFEKSQRFAKNYSREELQGLLSQFVMVYHDARRGIVEFAIGLERLLLTI